MKIVENKFEIIQIPNRTRNRNINYSFSIFKCLCVFFSHSWLVCLYIFRFHSRNFSFFHSFLKSSSLKASHYRMKIKIFFFFFIERPHSLTHSRQALIDYFRCDDISIINIIMIVIRIGILFYYLMVHKVKCQLNIIDYDDIDQIFDQFHHFHG